MNKHILINCDTDSIMIAKSDQGSWSEQEQTVFLEELNAQFPELIKWDHDGVYKTVIVIKAKNYVLYDGNKIKIKGSALKATTKCPALKEFLKEVIQTILDEKYDYQNIYYKYVREISSIQNKEQIHRWSFKKTLTDKVLYDSDRANETKVRDAVENTELIEGDKVWLYYKMDETLSLVDKFDGDYNRTRLYKNLYDTGAIFSTIINTEELFPNFSLKKRNQELLQEILK